MSELEPAYAICRRVESLLVASGGFGLTLSPLQRTIARVWDGLPVIDRSEDVARAFNVNSLLTIPRPRELTVLSGNRVGKTLSAAAFALSWAISCETSHLGPGEIPRVAIVSTSKDHSGVVFQHLSGRIEASPYLKSLLLEEPRAERILLRHPSGRPVEVSIVAGSRSGSSLVARWLAGVVFDEFALMRGQDDGVINWDEARRQVANRILAGGGILNIGSPWGRAGPAYQMVLEHWGSPTPALCVVKAPAWVMHPAYWTQERVQEAKDRDPDAFSMTVAAEFADEEEALFSGLELDRCTREAPELGPVPGAHYCAAMDPGFRSNSWTLVVATRVGQSRKVVMARQWTGTKLEPLSATAVLSQIAKTLAPYGITTILTDQYYIDALADIGRPMGLVLQKVAMNEAERTTRWLALRHRIGEGLVELPPDPVLRGDMQRIKRRVTQGGVAIVLPHTSDGRHCDYAPSLLLALNRYLDDQTPGHLLPDLGLDPEAARLKREQDEARKRAEQIYGGEGRRVYR